MDLFNDWIYGNLFEFYAKVHAIPWKSRETIETFVWDCTFTVYNGNVHHSFISKITTTEQFESQIHGVFFEFYEKSQFL